MDDAEQIVRDQPTWERSRNQQRNFETIIQTISLRAQPIYLEVPKKVTVDLTSYKFGPEFTGNQSVWSFNFTVEHTAVFDKDDQPLWALSQDMNNIPYIANLKETADMSVPVFKVGANIYFEKLI
jgi:hypothetical protein